MALIEIDGSVGEGGGQVIRTSVALATLLGKKIRIFNVRAKRSPKGLQPQHITGVEAVATLTKAEAQGLSLGSTELVFEPRTRLSGDFSFEVGTAGSISLVLQALMPAAAFTPGAVKFDITGGTDVRWSPTIDYMKYVALPILEKMGYEATIVFTRRGHYPKGGGKASMAVQPLRRLRHINLTEFGEVERIRGVSHCVKLPRHVAERQAKAATVVLEKEGYRDIDVFAEWYPPDKDPHLGAGSGILLYAETTSGAVLGADALGERGKPAEKVGEEAADKLLTELRSGMPVDRHMGDMLIPYMAVADGSSTINVSEVTMHLLTNVQITDLVAGTKFKVEGALRSPGKVFVNGLGIMNVIE